MISVILPCYREPKELFIAALQSIQHQTYSNIEIIVVVDGKNRALEEVLETYQAEDRRIRFFVNNKNLGLPFSLNLGISMSRGGYIARMDADDIALPERLEKELAYLHENNLDLVGTYCETIFENGEHAGYLYGPTDPEVIFQELKRRDCIWHPTWLFRWSVSERIGGYDNFLRSQDYHFLLKARKMGMKMGVLPEVCLKYRISVQKMILKESAAFSLLPEYFSEHADDIFSITPKTWEEYLNSGIGKMRLQEMEQYIELHNRFMSNRLLMPIYGFRLLMHPYGKKILCRKISRIIHNY